MVRPTWLNDRDQFLQPTSPLTDEFKTDCLMWMLFNRCNRTAGAEAFTGLLALQNALTDKLRPQVFSLGFLR